MSISEGPALPASPTFGVAWGAAIAGAIVAAALAFVLNSFGVALGLGLSSASPTWRDTSFALVLLSGLFLLLAALASYGLGGYVAGVKNVPQRSLFMIGPKLRVFSSLHRAIAGWILRIGAISQS